MAEVDIANSALVKLGEKRLVSLSEGTELANLCNEQYTKKRDELLRSHVWNFATERVQLARSARVPAFEFEYQYPLPADFLTLIKLSSDDAGHSQPRYRLAHDITDGRVALCDAESVYLEYVAQITDTNRMPPDFRETLAYFLAADIAGAVTNSNTLVQLMAEFGEKWLRRAKSADSIEQYPERRPYGTWVTSRVNGEW